MTPLKPAIQTSKGRVAGWGGARLLNCYAETADGDKRSDIALLSTPGLTEWANTSGGAHRGSVMCAGVLYGVWGNTLYSVSSAGVATSRGTIAGSGPVRIAANYSQVAVAAGGTGYVYSAGSLTTPLSYDVVDVLYADGYMIWIVEDSEQFFISALDDALTYDAADIASVEGFPDDIVGAVNDHREIQFYGQNSVEIFYNSGAADFPFERQGNAFIERGCFDRNSLTKIDNTVHFVGDDRIVYSLDGYRPQRISNHYIEYLLRDATYARAWSYTLEGHKFYVLECDRGTAVFDCATRWWHDRASDGSTWWRCNGAVDAYSRLLLTERATGQLFTASNDVFTEDGDAIAVEAQLPVIEGSEWMRLDAFEAVIETGVGNATVADPQIMLSYSDDDGRTWSNELWRSMGVVGEYRTRAVWRKLGRFRKRTIKLRMTDAARRVVIQCRAEIS